MLGGKNKVYYGRSGNVQVIPAPAVVSRSSCLISRGLPRCKNLWIFSLFGGYCLSALYCFEVLCCLARSLFYVTGEFHRVYTEDEP